MSKQKTPPTPPANTPDDKRDAIQSLLAVYNDSMDLEAHLRLAGSAAANDVDVKNNALSDAVDDLVGHAMDDWLADAKQVTTQMQGVDKNLQTVIAQIEQDVTNAAKIAQALGYVDQAIQGALKLWSEA
jgi:hypothetical protein